MDDKCTFRADVTRSVKQMAGLTGRDKYVQKECSQTVLASKEASVKSVMQTINSWQDPFDSPFDASVNLVSLSSGVTASDEVKVDLLQSYSSGEQQFLQFVQQRLVSSTKNFFDPLPKLKLKTFTTLVRKKSIQVRGQEVVLHADHHLMARFLVVAQTRQMDLRQVLS